ncbi:MAG: hypothetical protein ACUVQ3_02670 [bacterium]
MKNSTLFLIFAVLVAMWFCCSKQTPVRSTTGDFKITNLVFCVEAPEDYMKYKEQPNATYKPGDVVWIYMNLNNVKYKQNPDSSYEIFIPEHLLVKGPNGAILLDTDLLTKPLNLSKERDMNQLYLTNNINTAAELGDGKYTVNITVTDKFSNKTASINTEFYLKR